MCSSVHNLQVLWLTREMIQTGVAGADKLCFALLKQLPGKRDPLSCLVPLPCLDPLSYSVLFALLSNPFVLLGPFVLLRLFVLLGPFVLLGLFFLLGPFVLLSDHSLLCNSSPAGSTNSGDIYIVETLMHILLDNR